MQTAPAASTIGTTSGCRPPSPVRSRPVDPRALEVFKTKMGLRFDAGPAA